MAGDASERVFHLLLKDNVPYNCCFPSLNPSYLPGRQLLHLGVPIIGNLIRRNASISGAECGCQAEVGSACSMAAAAMCELMEFPIEQVEYAAEIAMEHHLGLTCDPICGLVQIPCIERNAVAAKRAIDSANLAHMLVGTRTISFDMVVRTMYETGISMNRAFRETSEGGLARLYSRRAGTAPTRK